MRDASDIYLSVIIPAFNEEKRIGATLLDIDKHLSCQKYGYEIIVVSDGSYDKTVDVVKKYKQLVRNLDVIDNLENKGKGAAIRIGALAARGKYRIFMDADNSIGIRHFDKMERLFEKGYYIVVGARDRRGLKDAKQEYRDSLPSAIALGALNIFTQIFAVRGFRDVQCGFKGFGEEAVRVIFPQLKINKLGFGVEILALAERLDFKVGVIPVQYNSDRRSHVTLGGYLNTFIEILLIKWNLWRNKYNIKVKSMDITL